MFDSAKQQKCSKFFFETILKCVKIGAEFAKLSCETTVLKLDWRKQKLKKKIEKF